MCSNDLSGAVAALTAARPEELSVPVLQEMVADAVQAGSRLGGWVDRAVGELAARGEGTVPAASGDGRQVPVRVWLRDATTCGGSAAGARVRTATLLREIPLVADAVLAGRLGQAQAAVLTRLVGKIPAEQLLEAQEALILVAAGRDPEALAVWVREQIANHCEPVLEDDQRSAENKRYLQTRNNHDGTVSGRFVLPSEQWESVATAIEPLARSTGAADGRSAGQRRADALVDLADQVLRHGELPDHGGQRAQVSYVVPAGWAAGEQPPTLSSSLAAELTGEGLRPRDTCARGAWSGPQTRGRIETLLCDARLTRVLLDSVGQVRGLEALRDEITPTQRRALAARDLGCVARGCTRPPALCDAHHLTSREDGGPTTLDNLVLLCRRHHVMWHQGRLLLRDLHVPWLTARATSPPGEPVLVWP